MGANQTKEKVIVNENLTNVAQVESKLNIIGIIMIAVITLLTIVIIYTGKRRCTKGIRKWLKKEIAASSIGLPSIKVETVQPPPKSTSPKVIH